ncbi:MAG: hypothetical protein O3A53_05520 [Acidobacteria bacterium]|nr:hypothetical protein [Acidobacteriota bacterium]MDA1234239.1 hypothetical protein [Acidobacteriota bacterium]
MTATASALDFLFGLNQELAEKEVCLQHVVGPGLPPVVKDLSEFITADCISVDSNIKPTRRGRTAR